MITVKDSEKRMDHLKLRINGYLITVYEKIIRIHLGEKLIALERFNVEMTEENVTNVATALIDEYEKYYEAVSNRLDNFLNELTELSNKHGLYIYGCGCCGSPWVEDSDGKRVLEDLGFDVQAKTYTGEMQ